MQWSSWHLVFIRVGQLHNGDALAQVLDFWLRDCLTTLLELCSMKKTGPFWFYIPCDEQFFQQGSLFRKALGSIAYAKFHRTQVHGQFLSYSNFLMKTPSYSVVWVLGSPRTYIPDWIKEMEISTTSSLSLMATYSSKTSLRISCQTLPPVQMISMAAIPLWRWNSLQSWYLHKVWA